MKGSSSASISPMQWSVRFIDFEENYRIWRCIRRIPNLAGRIKKKPSPNIKRDENNIMNIINDKILIYINF